MEIVPVKAFKDNYVWTLRNETHAAVVDPGEAAPVLDYLGREHLRLAAILATHHHPDHVGGIAELVQKYRVPVFGPRNEPIPTLTQPVSEGDRVSIPELGVSFSVLDIPGHTRAHVAYYGAGALFCGDTLFACGCGRLFEGTAEQMFASLSKLAALPDQMLENKSLPAVAFADGDINFTILFDRTTKLPAAIRSLDDDAEAAIPADDADRAAHHRRRSGKRPSVEPTSSVVPLAARRNARHLTLIVKCVFFKVTQGYPARSGTPDAISSGREPPRPFHLARDFTHAAADQ